MHLQDWRKGRTARLLTGLMLAALISGCAGHRWGRSSSQRAAYSAYLRGLMLERSSQFPDALDAYRQALERDHGSALLNVRVGATHMKLGQAASAVRAFDRALAADPDHPDALRWMAMLHASQGQIGRAIADYQRLLQAEPRDELTVSTLADLHILQGDLERAAELYEQLVREFSSSVQLHFNLGVLYGRMSRFTEALEELSRAMELAPDSLDVRVALGLTYELSGRFEEAAAHYEAAVRLDPLNARLYHHAARAHVSAQQLGAALVDYQSILDLSPRDIEAVMGVVRVRVAQRRFEEAGWFLAGTMRTLGDLPELYVMLGMVYREAKQPQEAVRAFERAIAVKADYAQAHFYLATALDQLGRRDEACRNLRKTLEIEPQHPDAMNYLGYLSAESGIDLLEAKRLIERAIALDPENGAYVDSLGWVYFKMGKLEEAIAQLERAGVLRETDPVIFDHLGDAYFKRRDLENARRSWERSLTLDPTQVAIQEKLDRLISHEAILP